MQPAALMQFVQNCKMMHSKIKFVLLSLSYFLITAADLMLTYFATPDLAYEGNPLVTVLEFGWPGLILINILTYIAFITMALYGYVLYRSPASDEIEIMRYLADITYGDPEKASRGMWRKPKYWAPQIACLCYSVSTALPAARLIIIIEWILLLTHTHAPAFFSMVALFPMGRIDFFIAVLLAWGLSFQWIYREFRCNKQRIVTTGK